MSVHPTGTGTGWTNVETVDVDQPHGKDYLWSQHIAKGVRKRINKEHVAFGDSTAGGEHIPGGCNVVDIVDSSANVEDGFTDGTYTGGGLVHETVLGRLWVCSTLDTTYDGATDVTLVKLHPDLQWAGQDVTWAGGHQFDATVDFVGTVAMQSDLTVDGKLIVDSSCDLSDVYVDGDISVKGSLDVATDLSVTGDIAVDGTAAKFGESLGIGLFYDPTAYAGGESNEFGNGLIWKQGIKNVGANGNETVTFAAAFPTALTRAMVCFNSTALNIDDCCGVIQTSKAAMEIYNGHNAALNVNWFAQGY